MLGLCCAGDFVHLRQAFYPLSYIPPFPSPSCLKHRGQDLDCCSPRAPQRQLQQWHEIKESGQRRCVPAANHLPWPAGSEGKVSSLFAATSWWGALHPTSSLSLVCTALDKQSLSCYQEQPRNTPTKDKPRVTVLKLGQGLPSPDEQKSNPSWRVRKHGKKSCQQMSHSSEWKSCRPCPRGACN